MSCRRGGRLCVNIGDQFARASVFGRYRVIPLMRRSPASAPRRDSTRWAPSLEEENHDEHHRRRGSDGLVPYPPNGVVEIDFEYILLLKKPVKTRLPSREVRELSAISREEWKSWFSGHWDVGGARKDGHEAAFPEEIPRRLTRMFSFRGDMVLDPFMGRGTTATAAVSAERNVVGYEIRADYVQNAAARTGPSSTDPAP